MGINLDLFGFVGLGLSAVSVVAAVYFWFNPRQIQGRLRYKFGPKARFGNYVGKYTTRSLYVDIWNPSAASVDKVDIREPLKVSFQNGLVAVSAAVEEVSGGLDPTKVTVSGEGTADLELTWDYLDQGMGFRLKVEAAAAAEEGLVTFDRPLRAPGRDWAVISGRFKDFRLERPHDMEDMSGKLRVGAAIVYVFLIATLCAVGALTGYDFMPWDQWLQDNIVVRGAMFAVASGVIVFLSIFALYVLDVGTQHLFNTRSPIDD